MFEKRAKQMCRQRPSIRTAPALRILSEQSTKMWAIANAKLIDNIIMKWKWKWFDLLYVSPHIELMQYQLIGAVNVPPDHSVGHLSGRVTNVEELEIAEH